MKNILHMSDIHYGKDVELEKSRLVTLAEWINKENININFLVFTGDMIDSFEIKNKCIATLKKNYPVLDKLRPESSTEEVISAVRIAGEECCRDYNNEIKRISKRNMKEIGELFGEFAKEINVDSSHIILCCGNHDCLIFANELNTVECNNKMIVKEKYKDKFSVYDDLCKILNDKLSHSKLSYSYDGCTFIIANSNWGSVSDKDQHMCVDCSSVVEEINKLKLENPKNCFFIAHKPVDDFCETAKFPYGADERLTMTQMIERTVSAFLYGDKHSFVAKNNKLMEFMCGDSLSKDVVHYNLIAYNDEGIQSNSFIINNGNEWSKIPTNDSLEEIYKISKKYLKSYAFDLLNFSAKVPDLWDDAIKIMEKADDSRRVLQSSIMFASCCETYPNRVIDIEHIYDDLAEVIKKSTKMQAVGVKGCPSVGKSTFMSIAYLYMLRQLSMGKINAIPFYFDLRKVTDEIGSKAVQDVKKFTKNCINEFKLYLESCILSARKHGRPLWLFITGLEGCRLLDAECDSIEKAIYILLETSLSSYQDRYVMCLNNHKYGLDTSFDQIRNFEIVFYLNALRTIPYKNNEQKLNNFLTAYLALHQGHENENTALNVISYLTRLHFIDADLSFMHYCLDEITRLPAEASTGDLLAKNAETLENISLAQFRFRIEKIQKIAGMLYSEKRRFVEIINIPELKDINISEYLNLCNHPLILNYLIARYYVQELIQYSDSSLPIPHDSILHCFIIHDVAVMVRVILDINLGGNVRNNLEHFIERHSVELNGYLYSMIVYLCGHLKYVGGDELLFKIGEHPTVNSKFFEFCQRRSYALAKAVCAENRHEKEEHLLELLHNDEYRLFNRIYQLYYYGDIKINSISMRESWNFSSRSRIVGFDFRSTFLILLSKLEESLEQKKPYPLLEVDLYTICDLIYSRLQDASSKSLFYSEKYNQKDDSESEAVLTKAIFLLEKYTKMYGYKKNSNKQIEIYFEFMKNKFKEVNESLSKTVGKTVTVPYVSAAYDFEKVREMSRLLRVGWNINKKTVPENKISSKKTVKKSNKPFETVMEHVMEAVYIAQMFLPEKLNLQGYDKYKVISVLLYADLGRTFTGDYSPVYSNVRDWNIIEEIGLSYYFVLGFLDGYADQPIYFSLAQDRKASDINVQIAWEIKKIQIEYKYYILYDQLNFDDARREDFESYFEEPYTDICKNIREQLIFKNPRFQQHF